jgi:hypothetical protein
MVKRGDACIWYFVNLIMDTTIGITLCYLFHKAIEKFAYKNEIDVIYIFLNLIGSKKWIVLL